MLIFPHAMLGCTEEYLDVMSCSLAPILELYILILKYNTNEHFGIGFACRALTYNWLPILIKSFS